MFQILELLKLAEPAKGCCNTQLVSLAELACFLVYLLGKLSGGDHNDPNGACPLLYLRLVHDVHNHGQHKGGCLA